MTGAGLSRWGGVVLLLGDKNIDILQEMMLKAVYSRGNLGEKQGRNVGELVFSVQVGVVIGGE